MIRQFLPTFTLVAAGMACGLHSASAGIFNMDSGLTSLEFVYIGNAGNAPDTRFPGRSLGDVDHDYLMGKYEITNAQWCEFLSAKASISDPHGLYNTAMATEYGGITQTWVDDHYVYGPKGGDSNWNDRPVDYISFWDAARFCNWLHNGQGNGDTESGAYVNIGNQTTFARTANARYYIPTEDEWYKSAFHMNDGLLAHYWGFASGDDIPSNDIIDPDPGNSANFYDGDFSVGAPYYTSLVGEFENSPSPYGTFDQSGNIREWTETPSTVNRLLRGGFWNQASSELSFIVNDLTLPGNEEHRNGLRIAAAMPGLGDANADGRVDDLDASILAAHWQQKGGADWFDGDFNNDGNVTEADASILASHWSPVEESTAVIPEPNAFILLAGMAALLLAWRRRN